MIRFLERSETYFGYKINSQIFYGDIFNNFGFVLKITPKIENRDRIHKVE